jgi:hypothetical protein
LDNRVRELRHDSWSAPIEATEREGLCRALEHGDVLHLPRLNFPLLDSERRFLDERWSGEGRKNISLPPEATAVRGAKGAPEELAGLAEMIGRYASLAAGLVDNLCPGYRGRFKAGATSFRPCAIENRGQSWRHDDTRMHVDSFPSNPMQGRRILRVFTNLHPQGLARTWLIGERFPEYSQRFLPRAKPAVPGASWAMNALGITKSRRSAYDHLMLQLHDAAKADSDFQRSAPRQEFGFPAGSTWICFTDCVVHAATSGQYALEQTLYVDVEAMEDRGASPLAVLEKLTGRALV